MIKITHVVKPTTWVTSLLLGAWLGFIAPTVIAVPATKATSAPVSSDRLLRYEDFKKYDKATVHKIQHDLALIYHDHPDWIRDLNLGHKPLTDDLMGPITMYWMQRYCTNFKVEPSGDFASKLPAEIARIAAFAEKHPAEKNILTSNEFALWNAGQAEPLRSQNYGIRRQGDEAALLALVEQFRLAQTAKVPAPAVQADPEEALTSYSYVLTGEDLTKLQGKDQLMLALSKLQDKPFADLDELKMASLEALAGLPGVFPKIWPIIQANSGPLVSYEINDQSLLALSQGGLAEATVQALEPLKDNKITDKSLFLQNVVAALKKPQTIKPSPNAAASTDNSVVVAEELPENDATTLRLILQEAEQANDLTLTEASLLKIKAELPPELSRLSLPAAIVKLLKEIQDISYPEGQLLHKAAQARFGFGIAACQGDVAQYNKYVSSLRLPDPDFASLKADLLLSAGNNAKTATLVTEGFALFEQLRQGRKDCGAKEREQYLSTQTQIYNELLRPAINALYQKKNEYHPGATIHWTGGSCGCVLDKLAGSVYGFYPFWEITDKPQTINFSVLSRVAYYGLSFDEMGEIKHTNNSLSTSSLVDDNSSAANEFIRVARRHNSKVDWVIEKGDWQGLWATYTSAHKAAVLDKLASNITLFLTTPLQDGFSKAKPYISLGTASVPTRGDGVTLYFKNYPTDADSVLVFNEFFEKLKTRLNAISPRYFVNVLVSQSAMANKQGIYSYANLLKLSRIGKHGDSSEQDEKTLRENLNTHVLVLLEEPSTDGKKQLRQEVENALHGEERKDLLRSILPVVVFDHKNWTQLQDDLIYFNDNFGGVGFWPLSAETAPESTLSCADSKSISRCISLHLEVQGDSGETDSALKKFICQNRWIFRIAMDFSLLLLAVVTVLYFRSCPIRSKITRYFPLCLVLFVFPPIVLFTLLLLFDPALSSISEGNLPFIISLVLLVSGAFGTYLYLRGQQDVPSRASLKVLLNSNQPLAPEELKRAKIPKAKAPGSGINLPSRATLTTLVRTTENLIRRHLKK